MNKIIPAKPLSALARQSDWQPILEAWLNTLDSENTRRGYRREATLALEELGGLAGLTPVALTEYRAKWIARLDGRGDRQLSPSSVSHHLDALRSFLRFARFAGQTPITNEVIKFALKSPKATVIRPYQVLTREERNRLIGVARGNPRDRVMLEFAIATGARSAELCNVRVGDFYEDEQGDLILRVRQGKGRKDRLVPIAKDTESIVRAYLKYRKLTLGDKKHADEYLFASRNGRGHGRMSTARTRQLITQYVAAAEIRKPISMHSLRHTAGMIWLKGGAPVVAVQRILGHSSLATTQRYLDHLGLDELKRVVNQA